MPCMLVLPQCQLSVSESAEQSNGVMLLHATCRVGREKRNMAEMCVKAVLTVADLKRKDVNLDLIKVRSKEQLAC